MNQIFTKILYELTVEKGMSLKQALEIIWKNNKYHGILSKTGKYLLDSLMQGTSFANGLRKCPYMNFDNVYIGFINFSHITGEFEETISFLQKRYERKKENVFKLVEVCVYPFIIVCLTIVGTFFLYFNKFFNVGGEIFIFSGVFLLFLIGVFLFICKVIGENKMYEAFLSIGFLLKAGINMYDAVGCGAEILGVTTKNGIKFQKAREKLLMGMNLESAFQLGKKYKDAFFFAGNSGGKIDVFEKLAKWIGENDEKRRKICFTLLEPVFIFFVGIFLILLVSFVFLPNITNFSFI